MDSVDIQEDKGRCWEKWFYYELCAYIYQTFLILNQYGTVESQ